MMEKDKAGIFSGAAGPQERVEDAVCNGTVRREKEDDGALQDDDVWMSDIESCWTYRDWMKTAEAVLEEEQIADAAVDAWYLMEYVTGMRRTDFLLRGQEAMTEAEVKRYCELVKQRASHIPLQHLTGEQEFMGFLFRVNEHVLIPRQDTEILVEEALGHLKGGMKLLDLCTGSGCIAVSLAKLCRGLSVTASDLSSEALKVARENGRLLDAEVSWIESDLFARIEGTFDMIVSNPPYIRTKVIDELSEEVRLHEPYQALDGHEDGLYFYRRIIAEAGAYLNPGGLLLFEIGYDQGTEVAQLMMDYGFEQIYVKKDLAGLDRVVAGFKGN